MKWGGLGSGGIARRRTIPEGIAAAPNARLAAVFDVDAGVNRAVAAQFGAAAALSVQETACYESARTGRAVDA